MPWKETCVLNERMKFIGEYLKDEQSMSELCRRFGISRKTGYKLVSRYARIGANGLYDLPRAPHHHPQAVDRDLVAMILALRDLHSGWGPRKLLDWLSRHHPRTAWPSASTIGRLLARHGRIVPQLHRRRTPPYSEPFLGCEKPNDIWCADFKGWFRTADKARCEPLTVTDAFSRYALACRVLRRTTQSAVRPVFESLFREYGLPRAIRTDNGSPFASKALGGLSSLSVWWIKLGIIPERIKPGCPQQNGRHERFHRTLKDEAISPPKENLNRQQTAFNNFCLEYNRERPHESLDGDTPDSRYTASPRPYPSRIPEIAYPDHMIVRKVRPSGQIRWYGHEIFISETLNGEPVAFEQLDDRYYQIYFGPVILAKFDVKKMAVIKPKTNRRKRYCLKYNKLLPMS
jgi:transposase InsO family protein